MKTGIRLSAAVLLTAFLVSGVLPASAQTGFSWPAGQVIPHFSAPADVMDGIDVSGKEFTPEERAVLSSLQGIVNRTEPRIFLFGHYSEGKNKWPSLLGLDISETDPSGWAGIVFKYKDEVSGTVLYSTEKSPHYINLASTVAGLENAIPVTPEIDSVLREAGVDLPVVADFTGLGYTRPSEIYGYLYDNYWESCQHRLLVSLPPHFSYVRDLAVASGAAVVWLDARNWSESTVLRKFLKDMTPGESLVTGWFAEERSGIGLVSEYGLSTVPSDFYENTTVYAGMDDNIDYPAVPKKPELENKIYLAVFLSDGDNVQYCQHAMSQLWDKEGRGVMPINWTISPALADFGPGLLNYYYKTATPNDFFASGPSGLGYSLIYDAHNYLWNATSGEDFAPYTKLTQNYLEKSGLRVITVWDEVNEEQRGAYSRNCRYLYGVTQQDWERRPYKLPVYVQDNRLAFIPNLPCYASGVDVIYSFWKDAIAGFDGKAPLFLSAQGESWKMGPDNIAELKRELEKLSPGNIVICRGDHFFNLYNEANHLPFNLAMSPELKVSSSGTDTDDSFAADGSAGRNNMWISSGDEGSAWITLDFGKEYLIDRYVIRNASAAGLPSWMDTKGFTVEVSRNGKSWTRADERKGNAGSVVDADIVPVKGRYVRISVTDPGRDGIVRIADIEVYGTI